MTAYARCRASSALVAILVLAAPASADVAVGENVNIVSGTEWPGGDPYLQRQNEPTVAVSSSNPQHLLAVTNDYRTVDIPNAYAGGPIVGEAWHGVFKSLDGGQTWRSFLLPGYPQDASCDPALPAEGRNPLCGMPAAADPVVRAGTDGMFYVAGLNFRRDKSGSRIFLARYVDRNDKENGDAARGRDPIPWIDTRIVRTAPAGVFVDKPWIAVDVPRDGALTCTVTFPDGRGGTTTRAFPGGTIWAGWSEFPSTGPESWGNVMISSSRDCGRTWSPPFQLNNANCTIAQGIALALDPITGRVHAAWRRFASGAQTDAIMATRSNARRKVFAAGRVVARLVPFDQGTGSGTFRTSAFPTIAVSSNGTNSWAHVAWQQRLENQEARIVVSSASMHPPPAGDQDQDESERRDEETRVAWSAPVVVDEPAAVPGTTTPSSHQLMPSLTFGQGRLVLTYYDSRLDHTRRYFEPFSPFEPDATGRFYAETLAPRGELLTHRSAVFNAWLSDANLWDTRHTLEVRVAVAGPGGAPRFASAPVSRYAFGLTGEELAGCDVSGAGVTCPPVSVPTFGSPLSLVEADGTPRYMQQLQSNPPNLDMFANGTVPFFGDYIDVQGVAFVPKPGGGWAYAIAPSAAPVFHAVWTSNQDVRLPPPGPDGRPDWTKYTPIDPQPVSRYDGATPTTACDPLATSNATGSRNQNVYTARITEGLAVASPQNVKPLSRTLVRAFVVLARNTTQRPIPVTFDVPAASVTPGVEYSWVNDFATPVPTLAGIVVPPQSHVYRSLFVRLAPAGATPALPEGTLGTLVVNVTEAGACASTGCRGGSVTLNPPNALATSLVQPDGSIDPIVSTEVYVPVFGTGTVTTPNITSPNITSPNITSPNITSPNITSPNITSAALSDVSYTVTNEGNTTTSYHLKIVTPEGAELTGDLPTVRAIVTRTYTNPTAVGCELKEAPQNQLVSTSLVDLGVPGGAVVAPGTPVDPGVSDPSATNLTFALAPGESVVVTLRGNLSLGEMAVLADRIAPAVVASAFVPDGMTYASWAGSFGAVGFGAATRTTVAYDSAEGVVTATVVPEDGTGVPDGLVTFVLDGTWSAGTTSLVAGVASVHLGALEPGRTLVAYYGGGPGWAPSTSAPLVAEVATTTTLTSTHSTWTAAVPVTFVAEVSAPPIADLSVLLGAGVEFRVDGAPTIVTIDGFLGASVTATLPDVQLDAGTHTVTARFLGRPGFLPSDSGALSQTIAGWGDAAPMLSARKSFAAVEVDGHVYAVGGIGSTITLEVYDVAGGYWRASAAPGGPPPGTELAAAALGGRIYAFPEGGTTRVYDPATDTWTSPGSAVPPLRGSFSAHAVTAGGRIFLLDGVSIREYLPASDQFLERKAPDYQTVVGRAGDEVAELGGKIYVLGGTTEGVAAGLNANGRVDVYDPVANTWTRVADLPGTSPWTSPAAAAAGGRLHAFGGLDAVEWSGGYLMRQAVYDPATNVWTELAPSRPHRFAASAVGVSTPAGEILLVLGGDDGIDGPHAAVNWVDAFFPSP